jgi:hypothetical protein
MLATPEPRTTLTTAPLRWPDAAAMRGDAWRLGGDGRQSQIRRPCMDDKTFDSLAKLSVTSAGRRRLLQATMAAGLGGLLTRGAAGAQDVVAEACKKLRRRCDRNSDCNCNDSNVICDRLPRRCDKSGDRCCGTSKARCSRDCDCCKGFVCNRNRNECTEA